MCTESYFTSGKIANLVGVANSQRGVRNATMEIIDLPGTCYWWFVDSNNSTKFGDFIEPGSFTDGELGLFRRFCIGVRGMDSPKCVRMPWLVPLLLSNP